MTEPMTEGQRKFLYFNFRYQLTEYYSRITKGMACELIAAYKHILSLPVSERAFAKNRLVTQIKAKLNASNCKLCKQPKTDVNTVGNCTC